MIVEELAVGSARLLPAENFWVLNCDAMPGPKTPKMDGPCIQNDIEQVSERTRRNEHGRQEKVPYLSLRIVSQRQ